MALHPALFQKEAQSFTVYTAPTTFRCWQEFVGRPVRRRLQTWQLEVEHMRQNICSVCVVEALQGNIQRSPEQGCPNPSKGKGCQA